ncbi:MAG: hypothetical protein IKD09_01915 [Lentisphaeria bacterium]|nr:hypothetical protein [Lentisphaeria bacterium]
MININNNNNNDNNPCNCIDNEEPQKSISFEELIDGVPKRTTYIYLCLTLGMFGIHELYVRRAVHAFLFFIFGAVSFFSGMVWFIPNLLAYLAEEKDCIQIMHSGIVLIVLAIITFLICIITALKWMFFKSDDDFKNMFESNFKVPLKK